MCKQFFVILLIKNDFNFVKIPLLRAEQLAGNRLEWKRLSQEVKGPPCPNFFCLLNKLQYGWKRVITMTEN